MNGLILSGSKNVFEVECDDGITRDCTIKGKILKDVEGYYNPLAPGDIVVIEEETLEDEKGQILSLVPRKNEFVRCCPQRTPSTSKRKITAHTTSMHTK